MWPIVYNYRRAAHEHVSTIYVHSFIHSFIQAMSIAHLQVHYYSEALPTQRGCILCRNFTPKRHRQLWVKDSPKIPTWRLERESNPWPFRRKASTLPMCHPRPTNVNSTPSVTRPPLTHLPLSSMHWIILELTFATPSIHINSFIFKFIYIEHLYSYTSLSSLNLSKRQSILNADASPRCYGSLRRLLTYLPILLTYRLLFVLLS